MDEGNSHNSDQIRESFGDKTLYEILGISKTATEDEIKKGYRKQALKMHPDKGGEPKMFQALSVVHSILSDPEKRKLYDETGDIDAEKLSEEFDFWYGYFRNMFPKLTTTSIIEFSNKYIGSQEENDDVMESYHKYNGDFQNIMDSTMCAEEGDEDRISVIINDNIAKGNYKFDLYNYINIYLYQYA
jgi:DnaJ family protein C protein 9